MKKIIITIFTIAFVSLVQVTSWAGFGDNTSPFSDEENSTEQIDKSAVEEQDNTSNFETDDKFSQESFSKSSSGGEQIMGPPPPRTPLDGSEIFLLIAGVGIGIKKLFGKKK